MSTQQNRKRQTKDQIYACRDPEKQDHPNVFCRPGGPGEEPKPDPISNSAVKLLSANGTVSQDPGE